MRRYFYIEDSSLADKGYNNAVLVYRLFRGEYPIYIGCNREISITSTFDALTEAKRIIARVEGYRMKDAYTLVNKNVEVKQL